MSERESDDGRCCENGYFGQLHDCLKQVPKCEHGVAKPWCNLCFPAHLPLNNPADQRPREWVAYYNLWLKSEKNGRLPTPTEISSLILDYEKLREENGRLRNECKGMGRLITASICVPTEEYTEMIKELAAREAQLITCTESIADLQYKLNAVTRERDAALKERDELAKRLREYEHECETINEMRAMRDAAIERAEGAEKLVEELQRGNRERKITNESFEAGEMQLELSSVRKELAEALELVEKCREENMRQVNWNIDKANELRDVKSLADKLAAALEYVCRVQETIHGKPNVNSIWLKANEALAAYRKRGET